MPAGPPPFCGRLTRVPEAQSRCVPEGWYDPSAGRGSPAHTPSARSTASSAYPQYVRQVGHEEREYERGSPTAQPGCPYPGPRSSSTNPGNLPVMSWAFL